MTVPQKRKNASRTIKIHRVRALKSKGFYIAQAGKVARRRGLPCIITPRDVETEK
jgi:hypothetical protein